MSTVQSVEAVKENDKEGAIVSAGLELFMRYGFKRVTMEDIAQQVGISRPALYLSFKNKGDIMRAVVRNHRDDALRRVDEAVAGTTGLRDKLLIAFEIWTIEAWVMLKEKPDARDLIDSTLEIVSELMTEGYEQFEARLVSVLKEEGVSKDAEKIARTLWVAARGAKEAARDESDLREIISTLVGMVSR